VLPPGWLRSQVIARQYTSTAVVPGIASPCDYSRLFVDWTEAGAMALSPDDISKIADAVWAKLLPNEPYANSDQYPAHHYLSGASGHAYTAVGNTDTVESRLAALDGKVVDLAARLDSLAQPAAVSAG
jgi:hypothetical protein